MPRSFVAGRPHPQSPGEQLLAPLLPDFRSNVFCLVRHVDFISPSSRVIVEVDGKAYHDTADKFELDRLQDAALMQAGYIVVRFASRTVTNDPHAVASQIQHIVAERGRGNEDVVRRWEAEIRAHTAERALEAERSSETRTHRLSRSIGNYYKDTAGKEEAAKVVKAINLALKRKYGPAAARSEQDWRKAREWLDDKWVQIRAESNIGAAQIPAWNATACDECGRFICEQSHCYECGAALEVCGMGEELCISCMWITEDNCAVCLNPVSLVALDHAGACPRCSVVRAA